MAVRINAAAKCDFRNVLHVLLGYACSAGEFYPWMSEMNKGHFFTKVELSLFLTTIRLKRSTVATDFQTYSLLSQMSVPLY